MSEKIGVKRRQLFAQLPSVNTKSRARLQQYTTTKQGAGQEMVTTNKREQHTVWVLRREDLREVGGVVVSTVLNRPDLSRRMWQQ